MSSAPVRLFLLAVIAIGSITQCGCDFTDDQARNGVVTSLSPYFPDVRALLDHQHGLILGVTCVYGNVGDGMLRMIDQQIRQQQNQLALLPLGGFRVLAIGFEHVLVTYTPATRSISHQATSPDFVRAYGSECKVRDAAQPTASQDAIFLGKFAYTLPDGTGEHTTFDTLGLYKADDFSAYQDAEVADRIEMIKRNMAARGTPVVGDIRLVRVSSIPLSSIHPN